MKNVQSIFTYKTYTLDYITYGEGHDAILCFHGFGRQASDFALFGRLLLPTQRMISVNLFGHGESRFPSERIEHEPLLQMEWKEILDAFLNHLHIDRFHLLGYSMGGRISLVTIDLMPQKIASVLLIAPDGLKVNLLYRFASGTWLGRRIYRSIIENPMGLFRIAKVLNRFGLLSDKLHRFVHVHMDTREKRMQVHDVWLTYREMFPDLKKTAELIRENNIRFHMIFGKYDSVITPKLGVKFSKILGSDQHMLVMEAGHRLITVETVELIREKGIWA